MDPINSKPNIQKKLLVYARDLALDKLNKKLEQKLAKQQLRRSNSEKVHEGVSYQRCSQSCDSVGTLVETSVGTSVGTSSEFTSSSSQSTPFLHSNEKLGRITFMEPVNNDRTTQGLLRIEKSRVGQSVTSVDSSGQDDDYQTADEDDELPIKADIKQCDMKPNQQNGISKNNDFVVEISDDKNDKLLIKPTIPQGQIEGSPHSHPHSHPHPHGTSTADYSGYIQKKSLAQGMMDLALVSANTNQLRYIIEYRDHHPYFLTSLSLVIASLFLQLAVGMTLIWNTRFNVKKRNEMREADKVNNFSVIGVFVVTLINVFLSTFGGAPQSGSGIDSSHMTTVTVLDDTIAADSIEMTTEPVIYI